MVTLFCNEDGSFFQVIDRDPNEEEKGLVDENTAVAFRLRGNRFESATELDDDGELKWEVMEETR